MRYLKLFLVALAAPLAACDDTTSDLRKRFRLRSQVALNW